MKTKRVMAVAVATIFTMALASEVMAAGGNGAGRRSGMQGQSQTNAAGTTAVRPAGSQRRDGTFLNTGTTASGATTRQGRGNGVMDGSHLTTPTPPAAQ